MQLIKPMQEIIDYKTKFLIYRLQTIADGQILEEQNDFQVQRFYIPFLNEDKNKKYEYIFN